MDTVVTTKHVGKVGLIALDNPPVNAASRALRSGLADALQALIADNEIDVIAIYGEGRSFIAGADIREFGKPPQAPILPEVCNLIEAAPKPVISVLHGSALGGGLEVAISTHARIAVEGVMLGFPEVTLGVIPGAGGTQRAPRLIGVEPALDLILSGRRIGAEEALSLGLVDRVAQGDPQAIALDAAQDVLAGRLPTRTTASVHIDVDAKLIENALQTARTTQGHLPSAAAAVRAIGVADQEISEGLAQERALFLQCLDTPERAGLIHAFFAERAVAKIPEAKAEARELRRVGVIGAGTMGSGIATSCLLAGLPVKLFEPAETARTAGLNRIGEALDGAVKRGKLSPQKRANVTPEVVDGIEGLADCDLIIEAAIEDLAVKQEIFEKLGALAAPDAILSTNTSYLDIDKIAEASGRPRQVLGLHFFSPAHIMRLLEVVVGRETAPEVVATSFKFAKRLRKIAVRSGVCDGFIGNRILSTYRIATDFMLLDGTPPDAIDAAMRAFGFKMGPFETSDLAGLDIAWATRKRLAATRDPNLRYHGAVADRLCEAGAFGRKTGRGYYDYSAKPPRVNPDLATMVSDVRGTASKPTVERSHAEIADRAVTAMIMEAARVAEDGIALRPIDVDAVFLFGYGFPRWKGGPLHFADTIGANALVARISSFEPEAPGFWRVPELLHKMAADGTTFADLNEGA